MDIVLNSPEWGHHFPLCKVSYLMRVRSYHAPIMLSAGGEKEVRGAHFYFEKQWLLLPNFKDEVYKMAEAMVSQADKCALDMW
jgi:hypothetical protein